MKWWTWLALSAGVLWWINNRKANASVMQQDGSLVTPDLQDNPYTQYEETAGMIRKLTSEVIGCDTATENDFAVDWVGSKVTVTDLRNNRVFIQAGGIEVALEYLTGVRQDVVNWGNYVNSLTDKRTVGPRPLPCGPWNGATIQL